MTALVYGLDRLIPDNPNQPYDMLELIRSVDSAAAAVALPVAGQLEPSSPLVSAAEALAESLPHVNVPADTILGWSRELGWRRKAQQEVREAEVGAALRSEGARFLRDKYLTEACQEDEMTTMSGSESS